MKKTVKIATYFPKHLFWDLDYEQLDIQKDKDIIIPRALFMTRQATFNDDITKLESLYTRREILHELKNTKERISNKVCEWVAERYSVPAFHRFQLRK